MTSIKVPPLGESIVEATVSRWMKKEGDQVSPGDTLVELETDKITVEVPAMSRGVLTKRLHAEGDVVKVDDLLGEIDESAAAAAPKREAATTVAGASSPRPTTTATQAPAAPLPPPKEAQGPSAPKAAEPAKGGVRASPAAERLATQQNIDLAGITGTGRGGVVSKADVVDQTRDGAPPAKAREAAPPPPPSPPVVAAIAPRPAPTPAPTAAPAPTPAHPPAPSGARETREKMSTRRRRIAEHLLESQHATAHLTTFNEIDMSAVEALRARIKERVEKEQGIKLSVMPFFVKAACMALKAYPVVNAQIDGDSIV